MRKLLRELLPGALIAPDPDKPDDIRTLYRVEVTRDGVQAWTEGGRQLSSSRLPFDYAVEVPDSLPRIIASWCVPERTWYITIDTSQAAASQLNVTVNARPVFDGREDPNSTETVVRINEKWVKTWLAMATEMVEANRSLLPYVPSASSRIEEFGRRRFAEGVRAVMGFIDGEAPSEELIRILQLAHEEKEASSA